MNEKRLRCVFDSCLPKLEKCNENELDDNEVYTFIIRLLYRWEKIGYEIIKMYDIKAYQFNHGMIVSHLTIKQLYNLCLDYSWIINVVCEDVKKLQSKL